MKNILFITTDEMHKKSISAFGATTHTTPNIDKLAELGTVYNNCYSASPVCLPARCTWMTGAYPHVTGSISNIYGASLSQEFENLFTSFKKKGYKTSLHGKCHFIPVPYPATRGDKTLEYEHFISYYKTLGMDKLDLQDDKNNSLWYFDDYAKALEKKGMLKEYKYQAHINKENKGVFPFPHKAEYHPDAWVGLKTIERIQEAKDDEPNFIWTSFSGPHYPVDTPQEYADKVDMSKDTGRVFSSSEYDDKTKYHANGYFGPGTTEGSGKAENGAQKNYTEGYWKRWRQFYFGNCVIIDEYIGKIIEAAEKKWKDNFIVVFTADHGEMMGNHSLWGKNGSLFEDVLRVPLIVYSPGQNPRTVDKIVSSVDVNPTLLSFAGIEKSPLSNGFTFDEIEKKGGRDFIISTCENRFAIVKDNFKVEWNFYDKKEILYKEAYDLNKDPNEFENVYYSPLYHEKVLELEEIIQTLEKEEKFLSTIFFDFKATPYYVNFGNGSGLLQNL